MKAFDLMNSRWQKLVHSLVTALVVVGAFVATTGSAFAGNTKAIGGDVMCMANDKVYKMWFQGSQSGWHGADFTDKVPFNARYKFTAVKKEQIKVWITCGSATATPYYTEFYVGRGSKRNICSWGGGIEACLSMSVAPCALRAVLGGGTNLISLVGCLVLKN